MRLSVLCAPSALVLSLWSPVSAIEPPRLPRQPTGNGDRLMTYREAVTDDAFRPFKLKPNWVAAKRDGLYTVRSDDGGLALESVDANGEVAIAPAAQVPQGIRNCWVNRDWGVVLMVGNKTRRHRHSYTADYFVFDRRSGRTSPLVDEQAGDVQYAELAPRGDAIAFVRNNNLFLRHGGGKVLQVTTSGGPDMAHGVPDWVYEEEVLSGPSALWFSPDGESVAFLSFNDTGVDTFDVPRYMAGRDEAPPYPNWLEQRYPKVGSPNPTAGLSILDVRTGKVDSVPLEAFAPDDTIVGEVAWLTEGHSALLYRAFNRVQDRDKHVVVNPQIREARVVRERDAGDCWLDNTRSIRYAGAATGSNKTYYADLSDESGWTHIYLYPVDGRGEPVQLTSGEWEVRSILHVDRSRRLVHYTASKRHSTESHVYSVSYETGKSEPLVDDEVPAVWSADFSPGGGFYILSYEGPDVPYQEIFALNDGQEPLAIGEDNSKVLRRISEVRLPNITYFELRHPDGHTVNVMQQLPPDFDESRKYPVLLKLYGGPVSQSVVKTFHPPRWSAYVSSDPELQYVVYAVDGRGTTNRGRAFRCAVSRRLGRLETEDQTWAMRELLSTRRFLDADHVGIYGESYGGFLAAKAIEADSGVFTFGISVSPVTDWRLYDSIFTERHMKALGTNADGYREAAIRNSVGFKKLAGVFSLAHGTGDVNVHYQNTAALLDRLVREGVPPHKVRMMAFTDSDHTLDFHGADHHLHKFLTDRLWDEIERKSSSSHHQWS
ncbi:hypothetical protein CDD83_9007 [Cordyceps sp. RAO-2017]|nr:hypothetical protein CDD83_9007 [Cordyceps sp. RAO-2017]